MDEFELMERRLVSGMKETMEKQDILLTDENISYFIKVALSAIIRENRYNCFTNRNDARDKLKEFKPSDYVRMVFDRVDNYYDKKDFVRNAVVFRDKHGERI